MIDLHIHSNISDGTCSPEELIELAAQAGVGTIALCDHDTTSGLKRFLSHAAVRGLEAIPGIEISAEWKNGHCHLLGLGEGVFSKDLDSVLQKIRVGRRERNVAICEKLQRLGMPVTMEELQSVAGGEIIARPHIARILVKKGFARDIQDAFERYLVKGGAVYVDRFRVQPEEAVAMLKNTGARVFLAHPSQLHIENSRLQDFVKELAETGLDGIEVYTPYTPDEMITAYSEIARRCHLRISGGSDFHGINKLGHNLGYYRLGKPIPDFVHDALT